MTLDDYRQYCLSFAAVTEELPFGPDTLVFKVAGKIFTIAGLDPFESINLKCDPDRAVELRERYPAVQPGYHMNKKHWNTIAVNGSINNTMLKQWIADSYALILSGLPAKTQEQLRQQKRL